MRERERERLSRVDTTISKNKILNTYNVINEHYLYKSLIHTREVDFDSQHAPSNTTFDHWIVGLDWSSNRLRLLAPASVVSNWFNPMFVLPRSTSCQTTPYPYSPSSSAS